MLFGIQSENVDWHLCCVQCRVKLQSDVCVVCSGQRLERGVCVVCTAEGVFRVACVLLAVQSETVELLVYCVQCSVRM